MTESAPRPGKVGGAELGDKFRLPPDTGLAKDGFHLGPDGFDADLVLMRQISNRASVDQAGRHSSFGGREIEQALNERGTGRLRRAWPCHGKQRQPRAEQVSGLAFHWDRMKNERRGAIEIAGCERPAAKRTGGAGQGPRQGGVQHFARRGIDELEAVSSSPDDIVGQGLE